MSLVTVPFYYPVKVDGWTITEIEGNATFYVHDEEDAALRTLEVDGLKIADGVRYDTTLELDASFPLYNEIWLHVDETYEDAAIEKYLTGDFYSGPSRAEIIRDDARVAAE